MWQSPHHHIFWGPIITSHYTVSLKPDTRRDAVASPGQTETYQEWELHTPQHHDISLMFSRFAEMLDRGLAQTAARITTDIKTDLQMLGSRIETIENRVDSTMNRVNQNTDRIQDLHDQLETAMAKIDDLENRSRSLNFRIRCLPETVTDIPEAVNSLIKNLIPDVRAHKMELDRAHRALAPPRPDGLPRDIVDKPHYYNIKEEVMWKARYTPQI